MEGYEAGNLATTIYFNRKELEALKNPLLHAIENSAQKGTLAKTPWLDFVLYFWDEYAMPAGSQFAAALLATDEGLADLAAGVLLPQPIMTTNPVYRSDVDRLEKWTAMDKKELVKRFEPLLGQQSDWLLEIHKIALKAFIDECRILVIIGDALQERTCPRRLPSTAEM